MKPTPYIVVAVLIGTGMLAYGLSQTNTKIFYVAMPVQAAGSDVAVVTPEASSVLFTKPVELAEFETETESKLEPESIVPSLSTSYVASNIEASAAQAPKEDSAAQAISLATIIDQKQPEVFIVPFISQLVDITDPEWKKIGCGIASLAMIINFHEPKSVEVNELLAQGITAGAYSSAGWTYVGLISVAKKHRMTGESYDFGGQSMDTAFASFSTAVAKGPVMASVHYKFEPDNPIPHLVVINGIKDNVVYYNDPASTTGDLSIPLSTFKAAWKKRYLEFAPLS